MFASSPVYGSGSEGEGWITFTESDGCGASYTQGPHMAEKGWQDLDVIVRGPWGAMFGRTARQAYADTVLYTLPSSSIDISLRVHERVVPALNAASANMTASGTSYYVQDAGGFAMRTIGRHNGLSRHGLGFALDVNVADNEFNLDGELVSDMPAWWVSSLKNAGFCWGGEWVTVKDAMHFSWMGPAFTPEYTNPVPYAPLTNKTNYPGVPIVWNVDAPQRDTVTQQFLVDVNNDYVPDVVSLSDSPQGTVIDAAVTSRKLSTCSVSRYIAPGVASNTVVGFGDWDSIGGLDLFAAIPIDATHSTLRTRTRFYDFTTGFDKTLTHVEGKNVWMSSGDVDGDGRIELLQVIDPSLYVYFQHGQVQKLLENVPPNGVFWLGDRDVDGRVDIFHASDSGFIQIWLSSNSWASVSESFTVSHWPQNVVDVSGADFDGDGRSDLAVLANNQLLFWFGNTPLSDGLPFDVWFADEDPQCEVGEYPVSETEVTFGPSDWISKGAVNWLDRNGFAHECSPADDACPSRLVSASELVAFGASILDADPVARSSPPGALEVAAAGFALPCALDDTNCWVSPQSRIQTAFFISTILDTRAQRFSQFSAPPLPGTVDLSHVPSSSPAPSTPPPPPATFDTYSPLPQTETPVVVASTQDPELIYSFHTRGIAAFRFRDFFQYIDTVLIYRS